MKNKLIHNNRGQLVVEYVLLLSMAAVVAGIIVGQLGSRNEDSPGAIIRGWSAIIKSIGEDQAEYCSPNKCK